MNKKITILLIILTIILFNFGFKISPELNKVEKYEVLGGSQIADNYIYPNFAFVDTNPGGYLVKQPLVSYDGSSLDFNILWPSERAYYISYFKPTQFDDLIYMVLWEVVNHQIWDSSYRNYISAQIANPDNINQRQHINSSSWTYCKADFNMIAVITIPKLTTGVVSSYKHLNTKNINRFNRNQIENYPILFSTSPYYKTGDISLLTTNMNNEIYDMSGVEQFKEMGYCVVYAGLNDAINSSVFGESAIFVQNSYRHNVPFNSLIVRNSPSFGKYTYYSQLAPTLGKWNSNTIIDKTGKRDIRLTHFQVGPYWYNIVNDNDSQYLKSPYDTHYTNISSSVALGDSDIIIKPIFTVEEEYNLVKCDNFIIIFGTFLTIGLFLLLIYLTYKFKISKKTIDKDK